ncbi:hypothetical protein ACGFYE_04795 [Streptomyces zaomyceticus]|uniref:hypothetical protein n=1 Tax=Streptomyces zaomyceticus TaxID=68286 RepID=UPI00371C3BAE
MFDLTVVGQVQHAGAADSGGGGGGGRPGLGDTDVGVVDGLRERLHPEPRRELARVHTEQS